MSFCFQCGAQIEIPSEAPVPVPESATDRLLRLVPHEFTERLLSTRGQVSKKRRVVTILFSDVKGSTAMAGELDPEDWTEISETFWKDVIIEPH